MQPPRSFRGFIAAPILTLLIGGAALKPSAASAQTLARIQSTGSINVGFVPDQPPFSSKLADGGLRGYAIDLCQNVIASLKERMGLPGLAENDIAVSPETGLALLERGKLDLLCGAVSETLEARARVSFSIPIYVTGIGALVRKDAPAALLRVLNGQVERTGPTWRATINAGLANHVYVVHAGTTSEAWVRQKIASAKAIAKVVTVDSYEEGIRMVAQKKADAYFADRAVLATYLAKSAPGKDLQVLDRRFTLEPVALGLPRGDEDFRLVVDTALSELYRSGNYVQAYSRHFGEPTGTARLLFQAYALP